MIEIHFECTAMFVALMTGAGWAIWNISRAIKDTVLMARAVRAWARDRRRADDGHDYQIGLRVGAPPPLTTAASAT